MRDTAPPQPAPAFQQHRLFADTLARLGRPCATLEGPPPLLAMQRRLPGGLRLAMLSRPQLQKPAIATLPARLRQAGLGRSLVIVAPDHPAPALARIGAVPLLTPATFAELSLADSPGTLRARLHQKWRNRLAHAEQQGMRVTAEPMPADPSHWLLRAEAAQRQARGYRGWPAAFTLAWARQAPGATRLFTAWEGPAPVAAMMFLLHGGAATYHIGHTTARGRALSAHTLLMWHAMTGLTGQGVHRLDLGPVSTARHPGLARFKLGTGARTRRLGGSWGLWPPLGGLLRPLASLDRGSMG